MTATENLDDMRYGVADLLPPAPHPDRTWEGMRRQAFDLMQYDAGMGPLAEFTGMGYSLGVYLIGSSAAAQKACAVAPSSIGGPPHALSVANVVLFDFDSWKDQPLAYARACLWALRQTALDAEREARA